MHARGDRTRTARLQRPHTKPLRPKHRASMRPALHPYCDRCSAAPGTRGFSRRSVLATANHLITRHAARWSAASVLISAGCAFARGRTPAPRKRARSAPTRSRRDPTSSSVRGDTNRTPRLGANSWPTSSRTSYNNATVHRARAWDGSETVTNAKQILPPRGVVAGVGPPSERAAECRRCSGKHPRPMRLRPTRRLRTRQRPTRPRKRRISCRPSPHPRRMRSG